MMRKAIVLSGLLISSICFAQTGVSITTKAFLEVPVKDTKGNTSIALKPAEKAVPGDIIEFQNKVENHAKVAASNIAITNPVPEHMAFVESIQDNTDVLYSVDGGKTFAKKDQLTIKDEKGIHNARPDEYTHVRWVFKGSLAPESSQEVTMKAQLK